MWAGEAERVVIPFLLYDEYCVDYWGVSYVVYSMKMTISMMWMMMVRSLMMTMMTVMMMMMMNDDGWGCC